MFTIEVIAWIATGLILGGLTYYFSMERKVSLVEAVLSGGVGGVVGGLIGLALPGGVASNKFSGLALILAIVGALIVLAIDWSYRGPRVAKKGV